MGNYWETARVEKEENKISIEPQGAGRRRRGLEYCSMILGQNSLSALPTHRLHTAVG